MTTTATQTYRVIGRCKSCKQGFAEEINYFGPKRVFHCGQVATLLPVQAKQTSKPCGGRCISAIGPSCDCSCGGSNHGAGHLG